MFDSDEEKYFSWYLDELMNEGYIESYTPHHKSYQLAEPVAYEWKKELKTKTKIMKSTLLQGKLYTPDFLIKWTPDAYKGLLMNLSCKSDINGYPFTECVPLYPYSVIEIKPIFDQNNMEREFRINQKWVYQKHGIYVQLIKPLSKKKGFKGLFERTFTPKEYLLTDKKTRLRTLHYKPIGIKEYLKSLEV